MEVEMGRFDNIYFWREDTTEHGGKLTLHQLQMRLIISVFSDAYQILQLITLGMLQLRLLIRRRIMKLYQLIYRLILQIRPLVLSSCMLMREILTVTLTDFGIRGYDSADTTAPVITVAGDFSGNSSSRSYIYRCRGNGC